jgi:hypothetical protein
MAVRDRRHASRAKSLALWLLYSVTGAGRRRSEVAMFGFLKMLRSSTFCTTLTLIGLRAALAALGLPIPWEAVMTGIGAFGAKEGLGKIAEVVNRK